MDYTVVGFGTTTTSEGDSLNVSETPSNQFDALRFSGVSELVLEVTDLESSEWFYGHLLELPVVDRWPDAVWVLAGSTRIGLWHSIVGIAGARGGAHVHFALHLSDADYDGVVARLRTHGFEPHEEVFEAFDRSRAAYVTDPDGNVVEFWTWNVARS